MVNHDGDDMVMYGDHVDMVNRGDMVTAMVTIVNHGSDDMVTMVNLGVIW